MHGETAPRTAPSPTPTAQKQFAARLLYVEDNPEIAGMTCLMLDDIGLEIIHVSSAEEALNRIAEAEGPPPFEIVLTDVVMPGISGVHLARRLNRRWPDLPVILVSGFGDNLATGYGAPYELLHKPFTRGALVESLQRHLDASLSVTA